MVGEAGYTGGEAAEAAGAGGGDEAAAEGADEDAAEDEAAGAELGRVVVAWG